ncbi:MAG: hypothetical protein AAGG48_09435 [Planctomycetota bacterium]
MRDKSVVSDLGALTSLLRSYTVPTTSVPAIVFPLGIVGDVTLPLIVQPDSPVDAARRLFRLLLLFSFLLKFLASIFRVFRQY